MNILYAHGSANPGGMEKHVLDLVVGLTRKGHKVYVWCPNGVVSDWYKQAGAHVFNIEFKPLFPGFFIDIGYIKAMAKFLKDRDINVAHGHEIRGVANLLIASYLAKTKVRISHIHTPYTLWPMSNLKKFVYTNCYSLAVSIFGTKEIALTQSIKDIKIKEGIPENKIVVIPNGLEFSNFDITSEQKTKYSEEIRQKYQIDKSKTLIGNISRTTQEKGHEVLICAYSKFIRANSEYAESTHLLIGGGGELEPKLNELIKSLGVEKNITITGIFTEEEKIKLYSSFDYFIFPSLAEGFGLVLIEAMYMGLPILASDLEVFKEVAHDTISYFKTGDAQSLETELNDFLSDKVRTQKLTELAKQRVVNNYSLDKFIQNYIKLYEDLNVSSI